MFSRKKSSRDKYEQLVRILQRVRERNSKLTERLEEESDARDEMVSKELREGMDEVEANYAVLERRLNSKADRHQKGEAEAVKQQTHLQHRLRARERELDELRNGRAFVPFLKLLERDPKFKNALAIYLDTNDRRLYVSPGFIEAFQTSEEEVLSKVDYFPERVSSRLKKKSVIDVQGEKFEVEPVRIPSRDGSHIGTYLQFHPQGPIDRLMEKINSSKDVASALKDLFLGLRKGLYYEA